MPIVDQVSDLAHGPLVLCVEILGMIIRNNKNIKGIVTDGEEYNFSRYAYTISFMFDGSPTSMDCILEDLIFLQTYQG